MDINLRKINNSDKERLGYLMQMYLHEISLYFPYIEFDSNICKYIYDTHKYLEDNPSFVITSNNDVLGFILVDHNEDNNYEISEIFILNQYKRNKIGATAVKKVFDTFRGKWTIKCVPNSKGAGLFWNNVIKEYTNDNYKLDYVGKYKRGEYSFKN